MTIDNLITLARTSQGCIVYPPSGVPDIRAPHILPDDMRQFYLSCGGLDLWYALSPYGVRIVPPSAVVLANPIIIGDLCPEDITSTWYIIAHTPQYEYLTIDLSSSRVGRCYDSFFDRHGLIGSCPIIATSFSNLLERLYAAQGKYWYWLEDTFEGLGDAYA